MLLCLSCKKSVIDSKYKGDAAIGVGNKTSLDSAVISFAAGASNLTDSTIYLSAQITGSVADKDRYFGIQVVDSLSTAVSSEYSLPEKYVLPAGAYETVFPVILKRSARLRTNPVRLYLKVIPFQDFVVAPIKAAYRPYFKLIWNDKLSKPASWPTSFGAYSDKKYELIIQLTGYTTFSNLSFQTPYMILTIVQTYVSEYNAANPGSPLRDENGNLVSYP